MQASPKPTLLNARWALCLGLALCASPALSATKEAAAQPVKAAKSALTKACAAPAPVSAYVLGDSLAYGLKLAGFEVTLRALLRGPQTISYDGGRSITTPGAHIGKTALESVAADAATIAKAKVVIIVLGTNALEPDFTASQTELMRQLKALAPGATYYWVDIAATMSNYADVWSERNKLIYGNATTLGYRVVSRYKAIFGADADPTRIRAGQVFPGMVTEPGYGGQGSIHGHDITLAEALLDALLADVDRIAPRPAC